VEDLLKLITLLPLLPLLILDSFKKMLLSNLSVDSMMPLSLELLLMLKLLPLIKNLSIKLSNLLMELPLPPPLLMFSLTQIKLPHHCVAPMSEH